jgi:acyl transferase domain-containing protein/NADPH:quinone reductase-like Zn-dependent oxidoreductase/NAD(P)-dependent dehydrogenase (short-subunit alcohol dehydrogenase family)/acyl carrier protein
MEGHERDPIAIVGVGLRLPGGANDTDQLWQLLREGVDAITPVPRERWDTRRFGSADGRAPGRTYAVEGGFLSQSPYEFDAPFFSMAPREASQLDPQQRLLLEASWEALEDAGRPPTSLRGRPVGVFVGGFCLDNLVGRLGVLSRDAINSHTATSSTMTMLANRVSHALDLGGPSLTVDTACSSSLVATHLACRSLWSGESELALAAGVNVILRPEYFLAMSKGGFLSRSGRCRAFDAKADGYVRGEGVGVVVLAPLSAALARGDEIHALILATGVNQDGRTPGISMPSQNAQERLIRRVHADPAVSRERLVYVEAHGPGTPAGDPIEARSLGAALGRTRTRPLWIGSIKTNVGHLEACAGVAGLIKAALVLEHRAVPPDLHFDTPNPDIDFEGLGLRVPVELESLPATGELQAAVNSFGYGGTNAHVVLATAPVVEGSVRPRAVGVLERERPFPVTAHDELALATRAGALALAPNTSLETLGHTLGCRREHLRERALIWAETPAQLGEGLDALAHGRDDARVDRGRAAGERRLVFVYTGMGAQYHGMAQQLLDDEPVFRAAVEEVDGLFRPLAGWSIVELLCDPPKAFGTAIEAPAIAQPSNFAVQVGLTRLWRAQGIEAEAVIGHSVGELAAAWAAGAISLEHAVAVTHHRARLQQRLLGAGGMLAVGLSASEFDAHLASAAGLELAAINGPASVVVTGELAALEHLERALVDRGVFTRRLRVGAPYHSAKLDALEPEFVTAIADVEARVPRLPVFSTVTGALIEGPSHDAAYFGRNARARVEFARAVEAALGRSYDAFVEIGPHRVLSAVIDEQARASGREVVTAASMIRGRDEADQLRQAFAGLFCSGVSVEFERLFAERGKLALPRYPWQRQRLWTQTQAVSADLGWTSEDQVLQQREDEPRPSWRSRLSAGFSPYLFDHVVDGEPVFPASGYVAAALAAVATSTTNGAGPALARVRFERTLSLADEPWLRTCFDPRTRELELWARADDGQPWRRHASATASATGARRARAHEPWAAARRRCTEAREVEAFYRHARARGLDYGPAFRCVERLWVGPDETLAELRLPADVAPLGFVHPVLLDGAFQTLIALVDGSTGAPLVPVAATRVEVHAALASTARVHARVHDGASARRLTADLTLSDPNTGAVCVVVTGLRLQALPRPSESLLERVGLEQRWHDGGRVVRPAASNAVIVVGEGALARQLSDRLACPLRPLTPWSPPPADARVIYCTELERPVEDELLALTTLVRALALGTPGERGLTIVTRDAHAEGPERRCDQAAIWGFARVVVNEHPKLDLRLVDVPARLEVLDDLAATLVARNGPGAEPEPELRLVDGRRLVPRLERWQPTEPEPTPASTDAHALRLVHGDGGLDDLRWVFEERHPPGPGEVEVATTHTSLNFKDLMKVMGMLDASYLGGTFFANTLGMETAGRIVAVGPDVEGFAIGDEVVAPNPDGSFRSFATVHTDKMIHRPAPLTLAESPAMINYVTAYHGLAHVADLGPGEVVLIHSATGGVGQAAIQVARWRGATILATAGTEAKRARLRADGIEHVFDSRSLAFVDGVDDATGGRGVDVVLNSLAGDMLHASWELLASHGRFVEIGKRDIADGHPLGLAGFDHNRSFHAVDIDQMMVERPAKFRQLLDEVAGLLDAGLLAPLPIELFEAARTSEALRLMSRGRHVGKIVIEIGGQELPAQPDPARPLVRSDRCYLITGGLTGFGAALARHLARAGAGQLWLVSRRGPVTPGADELRAELEALGAKVRIDALDVCDEQALSRALNGGARLPLAGVFHAAMVLDDGPIRTLDRGRLRRVLAPKIDGARALDRLTRVEPIEHFVLFSSVSAVLGNPNQANYAAANAYLDALAHRRRGQGLAGLAVDWGVITDAGVVARRPELAAELEHAGMAGIACADALAALDTLMRSASPQVCVAAIDWGRIGKTLACARAPRLEAPMAAGTDTGGDDRRAQLRSLLLAAGEDREAVLDELLVGELVTVLEHAGEGLSRDASLEQLGVDSLMAVELSRRVEARTGVVLPTNLLMRGPTIAQLTAHLLGELFSVEALDEADVDALSEAEMDAMLHALAEAGELEALLPSALADAQEAS